MTTKQIIIIINVVFIYVLLIVLSQYFTVNVLISIITPVFCTSIPEAAGY